MPETMPKHKRSCEKKTEKELNSTMKLTNKG